MATDQRSKQGSWPTTQITLLGRIADRQDAESWDCFVETYAPLIMRYCRRRGLQQPDACDVVQDVLLQVSKGIGDFRYDASRGRFRNWLGTVTYRALLKHQAKSCRPGRGSGDVSHPAPLAEEECQRPLDETWVETFNAHIYRVAVDRLRLHFDQDTWSAFEATFAQERSPDEVASELGRTVGWVYQAKSKVVRRLKDEILYLAEDSALLGWHAGG